MDYGAAGYGLYWYCIELIAKDVTPKNITFELEHDVRIIARNLNLSVKEVEDMMRKMISLKLFDISKNEKIACVKLAYRLDDSMRKGRQIEEILNAFNEKNNLVGKIPNDSGKSLPDIDIELDKEEDIDNTYCADIVEAIPFSEIINDLNMVTNSSFRSSSEKTKSLIRARWANGYRFNDFQYVHRIKFEEWGSKDDMAKYLRPETLYGSKFESYRNQKPSKRSQGAKTALAMQEHGINVFDVYEAMQ